MVIIPYIVLAAVAALFFAVSYFIICGFPMKRRKAEEMENGEEEKKGLPDLEKEKKPPVHKAAPVDDATRIIPVKPKRPAPVRFDEEEEEKTKLKLIPYYMWNNRGEGEMSVWVNYIL